MDVPGKFPFLLRALIVGEVLFIFVSVFVGFFVSLPPPLQEYLDAQGAQPIDFILIAQPWHV